MPHRPEDTPVLRPAFWSLLCLNVALFAYAQGLFGSAQGNDHEPARLKRQFNTAKMTLLTRAEAEAAAKAPPPPPGGDAADGAAAADSAAAAAPRAPATNDAPAAATTAAAPVFACTEIGPFDAAAARRIEARLTALDLGDRQSRQTVQAQDVTSWLVHIPPQPSREAAERKAAELRGLGVNDFFIMPADSPMKYAISLGVFKTEAGAQNLIDKLAKQGVHSARIAPRGPQATQYVYRLRNLDAATHKRDADYAKRYDGADARNCG
jgi:hypothetical protein